MPSIAKITPVVTCIQSVPLQLFLCLLFQVCTASAPIEVQDCVDWTESCRACEPLKPDTGVFNWDEHHGITSSSGCASKCKIARGCEFFAWNPKTQFCTTFDSGKMKISNVSQRHVGTRILRCKYCGAAAVESADLKDGVWRLDWTSSLFLTESVEVAVIYAGSEPNEEPLNSTSNSEVIMGDAKLVVPNNGSLGWMLPGQVSGNAFFLIRSVPYKEVRSECSSPFAGYVRLSSNQCVVDQHKRSDCGFPGIGNKQCLDKGCCYDDYHSDGPNCFVPVPNDDVILTVWWRIRNAWEKQVPQIAESIFSTVLRWEFLIVCGNVVVVVGMYSTRRQSRPTTSENSIPAKHRMLKSKIMSLQVKGQLPIAEAHDGQEQCVKCRTNAPNLVFLPCGHLCCCHMCLLSGMWELCSQEDPSDPKCPVCEGIIDNIAAQIRATIPARTPETQTQEGGSHNSPLGQQFV
mmetsp:Transcript_40693/g.63538  ORF Transcript_40693/g.63538 Transcript_40693/m.63538 type:complete len:461 (+) Transcript_40693:361-1743(+)